MSVPRAAERPTAAAVLTGLKPVVEPEETPAPRRYRLTRASEIPTEPVVWAWQEARQGRIPAGALTLAAGREGTGKSSFGIWLAAQVSRGVLPGSFHGSPRPVFYIAVEDSWKHTIGPRLTAAGADRELVYRFDVVVDEDDEVSLSLPHDNSLLESAVLDYQAALVVIDPLMSAIGHRVDTHREHDVRTALEPLAKLADRTGAVLLGIAHFNKSSGTDAASLITGSGAFKNVARAIFGFARDEDTGNRVMSQVKNSLGRLDELPSLKYTIDSVVIDTKKGPADVGRFTFTGESERSVADVLRDTHVGDPDERSERDDAAAWIRDYLTENGGEAPAAQVMKAGRAAGFSERTLKRARKATGVVFQRWGYPSTTIWKLPDVDHTQSPTLPVGPQWDQSGQSQSPGPTTPTIGLTD